MSSITTLTIDLESDLAVLLDQAAAASGLSKEAVVAECIAQHLEIAIRHRVLLGRLEEVDRHVVALAEFIGEATATPDKAQVSSICKYRPEPGDTA